MFGVALCPCPTLGHTAPIQAFLFANIWHHVILSLTNPSDIKIYLRIKNPRFLSSRLWILEIPCWLNWTEAKLHASTLQPFVPLFDGWPGIANDEARPPLRGRGLIYKSNIEPRVHYSGVSLPPYPSAPCSFGWAPRPAHPRAGPPTMIRFRSTGPLFVNRFITAVHVLWGLDPNSAPLLCFCIPRIMCNVALINTCNALVGRTKMLLKFTQIHSIFILEMYTFL